MKQDVSPSENIGEADEYDSFSPMFHRENVGEELVKVGEETVKSRESMSFHDANSSIDGETLDLNAEDIHGAQLHVSYNVEEYQRSFDRSQKSKERALEQQTGMTKAQIKKLIQTRESKIRRGEGRKETHLAEIERLTKLLN